MLELEVDDAKIEELKGTIYGTSVAKLAGVTDVMELTSDSLEKVRPQCKAGIVQLLQSQQLEQSSGGTDSTNGGSNGGGGGGGSSKLGGDTDNMKWDSNPMRSRGSTHTAGTLAKTKQK